MVKQFVSTSKGWVSSVAEPIAIHRTEYSTANANLQTVMIPVRLHKSRRTRAITNPVISSMSGFVSARIIRDCLIAERQHQLLPRRQHRHLPRLQSLLRRHASLSGKAARTGEPAVMVGVTRRDIVSHITATVRLRAGIIVSAWSGVTRVTYGTATRTCGAKWRRPS